MVMSVNHMEFVARSKNKLYVAMPHFDGMEDDILSRFYNIQFSYVFYIVQSTVIHIN